MIHRNIGFSLIAAAAALGMAAMACANPVSPAPAQERPTREESPAATEGIPSVEHQAETPVALEEAPPDAGAAQMRKDAESYAGAPQAGMDSGITGGVPAPLPRPTLAPPNGDAYPDAFFENYGVNPFLDTEDDPLSTFALDVDSGSYTIARSYLNAGSLPDKDSVRVEEFVNYFEQDYPRPRRGDAFSLSLDGAPSPFAESDRYRILRVGVQGYSVPEDERKDVSLTFVIDVSGSMDLENRLGLVKRALELLVEGLDGRDRVSIVVYGSEARVVLEPIPGDEQETILEAIHSLQPEGATNAEAGLRLGYRQALRAFNPQGINRVILCSDGVANVGRTGAEDIWETVKARASEGITLTTVGFGMENYNDVLMEQLADNGDGFYAYVDTLSEAKRLFVQNLTSTLQVIGMNAKIQVAFDPQSVARYRLIGFENRAVADEDFRDDRVDAGEIGAGHAVTALYEVKLHPQAEGEIARAALRWEDPYTHEVTEIDEVIAVEDLSRSFEAASPRFQWDVIVAEFAEILRQSYWAQGSSLESVEEEARRARRELPDEHDVDEFVELVRTAAWLAGEERVILD